VHFEPVGAFATFLHHGLLRQPLPAGPANSNRVHWASLIVVVSGVGAMSKENCLIVRAFGRELDNLRFEASRIAKGSKMDWRVERTDKGACFCFEGLEAKTAFSICQNFGVQHLDG
jgi:hypothetical protein